MMILESGLLFWATLYIKYYALKLVCDLNGCNLFCIKMQQSTQYQICNWQSTTS